MKNIRASSSSHDLLWLLRYELKVNAIAILGAIFGILVTLVIPSIISGNMGVDAVSDFSPSPSSIFIWVYLLFFSLGIFGMPMARDATGPGNGLDFVFTRAINRKSYFRAKAALYLFSIVTPLSLYLGWSFFRPDLELFSFRNSRSEVKQQQYLQAFPGSYEKQMPSSSSEKRICIPNGHAKLAAWQFWRGLLLAWLIQALAVWLARHREKFTWIRLSVIVGCVPVTLIAFKILLDSTSDWTNTSFIFFNIHLGVMFAALFALGCLIQLYCERRFEKMEVL